MHIVLTRPMRQSEAFADELRMRFGADLKIVIAPAVEIIDLPFEVDFSTFDALVFTSQNGVYAYRASGGRNGMTAYCVGTRTAEVAQKVGLKAVSANGDIHALNALLARDAGSKRLLHISGRKIAGAVTGDVTRIEAYDQRSVMPPSKKLETLLMQAGSLIVPLFSPYVATRFQTMLDAPCKASVTALCISQAVAEKLESQRFAGIGVCAEPTAEAMIFEIGKAIESQTA